jgi:hypothetical protein
LRGVSRCRREVRTTTGRPASSTFTSCPSRCGGGAR